MQVLSRYNVYHVKYEPNLAHREGGKCLIISWCGRRQSRGFNAHYRPVGGDMSDMCGRIWIAYIRYCIVEVLYKCPSSCQYGPFSMCCRSSVDPCKWYSAGNSTLVFQSENGTKDKHGAAANCGCSSSVVCIWFDFLKGKVSQNIWCLKVEVVTNLE